MPKKSKQKDTRGGARPGAGRPTTTVRIPAHLEEDVRQFIAQKLESESEFLLKWLMS